MRRISVFAVLFTLAAFSSNALAQLPPWTRFTLDNGLEVLVVENHLTPIVTIEIAVKNGSFTESPEYNGLSHLYEHMFFTANSEDSTEDEFLGRVDDLGIVYNGETHEENVQYYFTLPKENLKPGLSFMATAIMNPLFREDELHKQREIVLGEFDRHEAQPLFQLDKVKIPQLLWGEYISRKDPLGQRRTIGTATKEKMLAIKSKYYVPNNSLLIVAGDVKTEEIRKLIPLYFGRWQRGGDPFVADPPPTMKPLTGSSAVLDTVDQPNATVLIYWHGPSIGIDDKSTYAADVFSYIIGQQEHEFKKKLDESGLAQGTNFWYYTQRNVGPINAVIQTTPEKLYQSLQVFWDQVKKFDQPGYYTDEELEIAKQVLRTRALYDCEQLSRFSQNLGFWWASTGLDYYEKYLDDLSKITKEDINEYVRRYVLGKPYVIGVATNREAIKSIRLTPEKLLNVTNP